MKSFYILSIISILLTGCASPKNVLPEPVHYNHSPDVKYPAVSIIVDDGLVSSYSGNNIAGGNPDVPVILNNLRDSGLFKRVDMNNAYAETVLDIHFTETDKGSPVGQFFKSTILGLSLFLMPVPYNYDALFTVDVRHKNKVIASYRYDQNYTEYLSAFNDPGKVHQKVSSVMLSRFYRDIQKDNIFSGLNE